ncbi:MAG: secretin N-terminal domain-containing protein [Nitrospinota bacterium]
MRCFKVLILFLIFCIWTTSPVAAQKKLEIIPLKNRFVEEVIPTIRSVLGKRGTVTGTQGRLIIRASPQALKEAKEVLRHLDSALKNLKITVKQGTRLKLNEKERSISARVPLGKNGRVIIGESGSNRVILNNDMSDAEIEARILDRMREMDETDTQVVITLEGRPALIHVTQSIPVTERRNLRSFNSISEVETIRYQDVRTGLTVIPRLKGNHVFLEVSPQKSKLNGEQIENFGINTVVKGRVGEWMELGGLTQGMKGADAGIGQRNSTDKKESRKVFLKVDYE